MVVRSTAEMGGSSLLYLITSLLIRLLASEASLGQTELACCTVLRGSILDPDESNCSCYRLEDDETYRVRASKNASIHFHWKLRNYSQMSVHEGRPPFTPALTLAEGHRYCLWIPTDFGTASTNLSLDRK